MGEFKTERIGTDEFLSYILDEQETIDRVACGMLENNAIAGLMPMQYSQMNEKISLKFCIRDMATFADYINKASRGRSILLCLKEIASALAGIGDYMLEESMCVFEPEHIYVDETGRARLICLPLERAKSENDFRTLCISVINLAKVVRDVRYDEYTRLKQYLKRESVLPREFAALLEAVELNSAIVSNEEESGEKRILGRADRVGGVTEARTDGPIILSRTKTPPVPGGKGAGPVILSRNDREGVPVKTVSTVKRQESSESETVCLIPEEDETAMLMPSRSAAALLRKKTGEKIRIEQDMFRIGKREDNDYCISDNPTVSRYHAVIRRRGDVFFLMDQSSKNGTYINGRAVGGQQEIALTDQTQIKLSNEEFLFLLDADLKTASKRNHVMTGGRL